MKKEVFRFLLVLSFIITLFGIGFGVVLTYYGWIEDSDNFLVKVLLGISGIVMITASTCLAFTFGYLIANINIYIINDFLVKNKYIEVGDKVFFFHLSTCYGKLKESNYYLALREKNIEFVDVKHRHKVKNEFIAYSEIESINFGTKKGNLSYFLINLHHDESIILETSLPKQKLFDHPYFQTLSNGLKANLKVESFKTIDEE